MGEFELIERWFAPLGLQRSDVMLGIGDDAAIVSLGANEQLVAAVDTLVAGRHFPLDSPPRSIGHRALAVNLSDLAAMGATPRHALLALTLPQADAAWLRDFVTGFGALARRYQVALIGGDTTAGPLTISVTLLGAVPAGQALTRGGARAGDGVYVSGTPGDAAAGLQAAMAMPAARAVGPPQILRERFEFPEPRVALGAALLGVASACIDVSDGLGGDLGKLAAASGCGIEIEIERLPLSSALLAACPLTEARNWALTGGDDYELAFTVPAARVAQLEPLARHARIERIGTVMPGSGVTLRAGSTVTQFAHRGFDHFPA